MSYHSGYSKEEKKRIQQYQQTDRYEKTRETEAIVNAKFQYVVFMLSTVTSEIHTPLTKTFLESSVDLEIIKNIFSSEICAFH